MENLIKKTGLFLQVRLNSKRMPGKALYKLSGKSILLQVIERLNVIPADIRSVLTTKESEPLIKDIVARTNWDLFIGDDQNVLKRFVDAALYYNVNTIVRATADNPLVSSEIAIETINFFNKKNCDLAYMDSIPYGSGVEVVKTKALINALQNTKKPYDLEHVTPYIYNHKDKFKIKSTKFNESDISREDIRLTIDTKDDFEKMNHFFRHLSIKTKNYKIKSLIDIYDEVNFNNFKRALFITAYSESYGMGHLKRINLMAEKLSNDFNIYYSFKYGNKDTIKSIKKYNIDYLEYNELKNFVDKEGVFDRVIVDLRDTTKDEMIFYNNLGTVISIDDMGVGGQISDINIRSLPYLKDFEKLHFNYDDLKYFITDYKYNKNRAALSNPPKKILITFGGSDPVNLTVPIAYAVCSCGYDVKVVIGPYFKYKVEKISTCEVLYNVNNLEELMMEADLIITSFGLTLLEALIKEKPVLIANPSKYHEQLTVDFSYPYYLPLSDNSLSSEDLIMKFKEIINKMISDNIFDSNDYNSTINTFYNLKPGSKSDILIDMINNCNPSIPICPNCSTINNDYIHRSENYNMSKCKKCDLIYLLPTKNVNFAYDKSYFIEEYKESYGKTYEDDKINIIKLAKRRFSIIKEYVERGKLLDFGSGLGFFSEYCQKNGFHTTSIDISKFAVDYIKENLNLEAIHGNEDFLSKSDELFDVITSFYVLEHIKDFKKLLFIFNCHLKKNGLLVLSTPNSKGISIKNNFQDYVKNHPEDHFNIFSPAFLKNILKKSGYSDIKIIITGIHVDRFIKSKKLLKNNFICKIIKLYAKLFHLGDTFEIYARKIAD